MDEIQKTQDEMKKLGKEEEDLKQSLEYTGNVLEENDDFCHKMKTFAMKPCNIKKSYGRKSKDFVVRAK